MKIGKVKSRTLSLLFGNTPETIRNWIKEKRTIILFINKYFTNSEIEEFLETNKINRLIKNDEYKEMYNCLKQELTIQCDDLIKSKNQAFIDFGLYLARIDKNVQNIGPISTYNKDLFEQLLMEFNGYLIDTKNKRFIKTLAEVESFYNSLNGTLYKYYFHKEFMWMFTLENKKRINK